MKAIQSALINLPNVNINGSPTITSDCIASGFSKTNYLKIPYDYVDIDEYSIAEVVICIITGNDITGDQPFAQAAPMVDISVYNGDLSFWVFGDGTHNTITTASPNTKYWIKERVLRVSDSYNKTYSYSTDGINYSATISRLDDGTDTQSLFTLGVTNWFGAFFTGAIDLSECYIKVNNNIVWRGVKQGRKIKAIQPAVKTYINEYGWQCWGNAAYTLSDTPLTNDAVYDYSYNQIGVITGVVNEANVNYYGWKNNNSPFGVVYTLSPTPNVGDYYYSNDEYSTRFAEFISRDTIISYDVTENKIICAGDWGEGFENFYYRDSALDTNGYNYIKIQLNGGGFADYVRDTSGDHVHTIIVRNTKPHAVTEPVSINYYCWQHYYFLEYIWTISPTPNKGDYIYRSPNPQGIGSPANTVDSYNSTNDSIVAGSNFGIEPGTYNRYTTGDTTYTGTNYKLVNQ